MRAQLGEILAHLPLIPLRNNLLHLPDEIPARRRDGPRRSLEPLLRLAHETGLDTRRGHELRGRGSDVVGGDDELFVGGAAGDDGVGCFDEGICACGDGFGCGDETLCPAVVFFVELGSGSGTATFADDLLLRGRCCLDELGDCVGDGDGGFEDGAA